jgi:hypothetical protein
VDQDHPEYDIWMEIIGSEMACSAERTAVQNPAYQRSLDASRMMRVIFWNIYIPALCDCEFGLTEQLDSDVVLLTSESRHST